MSDAAPVRPETIRELETLLCEALDGFASDMDPSFLESVALDLCAYLPIRVIARAAAQRIERLTHTSMAIGLDTDVESARLESGQGLMDLIAAELEAIAGPVRAPEEKADPAPTQKAAKA